MTYAEMLDTARRVVATACMDCHEHTQEPPPEDSWLRVVAAREWCSCRLAIGMCGTICDTSGAALIELIDGRFVAAFEWSDTSGHG